jgi:carboxylesterase
MRPWADYLAAEGYAVRLPLLPGHGTTWQDMATRRWREWHHAADAAYLELQAECDFVFAAGLSMGGALALRIAATRPVAGTVVVNPGLVIDDPRAAVVGLLKLVLKSTPAIANDILKAGVDEGAYPRTPVAAAHELKKMYKDTIALLPRISAPVRVFRSSVDHVVSDASIKQLKERITAPMEFSTLANSYHVATLDNDALEIFRGSAEFIRRTMAGLTSSSAQSATEAGDSPHE